MAAAALSGLLELLSPLALELLFLLGVLLLLLLGRQLEPLARPKERRARRREDRECGLVPQIEDLCRQQVQRALDTYRQALRGGLDLRALPREDLQRLLVALVTAVIRVGRPDEALRLLRELRERGPGVPAPLLGSAVKLCTAKQLYGEALQLFDLCAEDPELQLRDRSVWSCLLFCAVESQQGRRCEHFFERVAQCGQASSKDYGNMVRHAAATGDPQLSLRLVKEMREQQVEIDSVVYNTVLAVCVNADKVEQAHTLLREMEGAGNVADVITYNTLMKGYSKSGRIEQCFELYEHMRRVGIAPSQVTYGILLDVCVNENKAERAAEVYAQMREEGCPMNTVLYTTLIKGFARMGQVDQAMKTYEQMREDSQVAPDVVTFSTLIRANCDARRLEAALGLLEQMRAQGLKPDLVVFNNLLMGCLQGQDPELARRLYADMSEAGIHPSSATFSILIRLCAQHKQLEEAVEMLRREPRRHRVSPEPRVFSQLVQCCLRERQGRRAVEVYRLMLEHGAATAAAHGSLLQMCAKLNMLETGAEVLQLAAEHGGRVDAQDAQLLCEAAGRKRKQQCREQCEESMRRLGLLGGPPA